ncbi:MAG: hypothetical protein Q9227_007937 [Pyrenula ochraceoflavens]
MPLVWTGRPSPVVDRSARIDQVPEWFPAVRMNFAENLLFSGDGSGQPTKLHKEDNKVACTEVREGSFQEPIKHVTWRELRSKVGRMASAMRARGVRKGDRVAVVASNSLDTLTVFLAVTSIGGIFSSSSTDMGKRGILDRLLQIRPMWLFMDDMAVYNGKTIDLREKMTEIVQELRSVKEFKGVVSQARFPGKPADISDVPKSMPGEEFISTATTEELEFEQVKFCDPFLIVYSSGTTGMPKAIMHSVGGVILSASRESRLHRCLDQSCSNLQYTTTGWIMYLSTVLALLSGARLVMYDGSPFLPDRTTFLKLVGEQKVTHLGISPRYLHELQKNSIVPKEVTDLSALRTVTSTGMVLSEALFEWFYDVGFPPSVHLDNISGGTDLAGCFAAGNPLTPVYCGGTQGPSLGLPVKVYEQTPEEGTVGKEVPDGVPGELVAPESFPNMPVGLWGDPERKKYFNSYFKKFDNVWTHGDFIMVHPLTKGIIFLGRADGVLNPSGVRFGSAEIYSVIEAFFSDRVADSICVGQRRPHIDTDESVMLFLLMRPNAPFTPQLVDEIKQRIAQEHSKRHVPKYVFETPEIPTTINLKKVELPVKQIVSGHTVKPSDTLANPGCLDFYYQFAKVEELADAKRVRAKL